MEHPLDRPAWSALSSRHSHLSVGGALAYRYAPGLVPFVMARDDGAESLAAAAQLVGADEQMVILAAAGVATPPQLAVRSRAVAIQMAGPEKFAPIEDARVMRLGLADAPEMLELALLTKPGPFTARSLELGDFWGIRIDGCLAAMAGERMKMQGWTELSGVCAHPDFRGQGLARALSHFVGAEIVRRGYRPFLQAFENNPAAVGLYTSLGFTTRATMDVIFVARV